MGFAADWLSRRALFPRLIREAPDENTGIIVVVPAYDEPSVTVLLDSLNSCIQPHCATEVIIVVNAPANASEESLKNNAHCIRNIENWKSRNNSFFRLFIIDAGHAPVRGWGVGLARKTGMDEAVRRFDTLNMPDGIIACLDADCTVAYNYFTSFYKDMLLKKDRNACSVYFEHVLSGNEFPPAVHDHIIQYELHLRYYVCGLRYAGFPDAFHTVGSALAVKARHYVMAGGMNRRQAGEDFYFVQKLVPLGGYFALNSTSVYPSPRESGRVPFGTGAAVSRLMADSSSNFYTYNVSAFRELKKLLETASALFEIPENRIEEYYNYLPEGIRSFTTVKEWSRKIEEIRNNTSSAASFSKRFFSWFNAFRIVKYMNHVHTGIFIKRPVTESAAELLGLTGSEKSADMNPRRLLDVYRLLDRHNG